MFSKAKSDYSQYVGYLSPARVYYYYRSRSRDFSTSTYPGLSPGLSQGSAQRSYYYRDLVAPFKHKNQTQQKEHTYLLQNIVPLPPGTFYYTWRGGKRPKRLSRPIFCCFRHLLFCLIETFGKQKYILGTHAIPRKSYNYNTQTTRLGGGSAIYIWSHLRILQEYICKMKTLR